MSHTDKHTLGGTAHHEVDTLGNLNAIISDLIATYGGIRDIGIGTLAQRPAFGTANRLFYTTDEQNLYRDTGAAWEVIIADASASQRGLVNLLAQSFAGQKTFLSAIILATLNSGDELIKTSVTGEVQESGVVVTEAPAGGSGFTLVEYSSDPVNPPAGFLWIQNVGGLRRLRYFDGTAYHFVDM